MEESFFASQMECEQRDMSLPRKGFLNQRETTPAVYQSVNLLRMSRLQCCDVKSVNSDKQVNHVKG